MQSVQSVLDDGEIIEALLHCRLAEMEEMHGGNWPLDRVLPASVPLRHSLSAIGGARLAVKWARLADTNKPQPQATAAPPKQQIITRRPSAKSANHRAANVNWARAAGGRPRRPTSSSYLATGDCRRAASSARPTGSISEQSAQ